MRRFWEIIILPAVAVVFWGLARLAQGTATEGSIIALVIGAVLTISSIISFERRRS